MINHITSGFFRAGKERDMTEQTYPKDQNKQKEKRPYGLLGKTLKHSFSPQLHAAIGALLKESYPYILFEKQP